MAHLAILTPPDPGHLYPLGNLGVELMRRGHQVTVIAHERAATLTEQLGLPFRRIGADDLHEPPPGVVDWVLSLFGAVELAELREWFRWESDAILQLVPNILDELKVDGVIMDQVVTAGGTIAEKMNLPFVTVCTGPPLNEDPGQPPPFTSWSYAEGRYARFRNRLGYAGWKWFNYPTLAVINRYRKTWGLRPFWQMDKAYSPLAQINQLFPEFDFPRHHILPHFHYVGSLSACRVAKHQDFPWERLDGRPIIYASLGTIADTLNRPVYPKIASACVGLDAQLVMALGKWNDLDTGRENMYDLPGNPLVVDFAPQLALLEQASMMITHAGMNTTMECISRGVPMVAMPRNADQPANAARIEYSGAGLIGSFYGDSAEELRTVIKRVLSEDSFRLRAKQLQVAMQKSGGVRRAADITEQAIATQRPVLQNSFAHNLRPRPVSLSTVG